MRPQPSSMRLSRFWWNAICIPLTAERALAGCRRCHLSTQGRQVLSYVDKWFDSIMKDKDFYGRHAEGDIRRYFYNIDMQGRLFLEETTPKNIATSIKDEKFLDFFFSRIQWARDSDRQFLGSEGVQDDYPFVSLCGKEINYIRPAATPIVFHSLVGQDLHFGGNNLNQPFRSSSLAISLHTGRLYHEIGKGTEEKGNLCHTGLSILGYGLIRSSVAVGLSEHIYPSSTNGDSAHLYFVDKEGSQVIQWLPDDEEPGAWSLPGDQER